MYFTNDLFGFPIVINVRHNASFESELQSIGNQVDQYLKESLLVAHSKLRHVIVELYLAVNFFEFNFKSEHVDHVVETLFNVKFDLFLLEFVHFYLRPVDQIMKEGRQKVARYFDCLQSILLRYICHFFLQERTMGNNGVQGVPHFM